MAKTTLGRGLGDLLGSNRIGADPSAPVRPPGVGLKLLIKGVPAEEEAKSEEPAKPATTAAQVPSTAPARSVVSIDDGWATRALAVFGLILADVVLLAWTAHYVLSHAGRLSLGGITACVVTALAAAVCGCAAARLLGRV